MEATFDRGGEGGLTMAESRGMGVGGVRLGFKRYPKYRDSGVEWLGEIPAHWEVKRLKTIARVQLSNVDKKTVTGQVPVTLCNYVDVYYNDKITDDIDFMPATATEYQVERFSLRRGDVLITKDSEDGMDIAVPAVVAENVPGVVCGYHLAQIRPNAVSDGSYLARAFIAAGVRDQFSVAANGITRFGLTSRAIGDSVFAVPPLAEQRAIAAFLDRETGRIDALMEKKQRLVELLQEKRTSLIGRAVTKGLDPDAPMQETGVKWLGAIPAHWEVQRLKMFSDVRIRNVDKKAVGGQVAEDDIAVPSVIAEDLPDVVCGYYLAQVKPGDRCDGRYLKRAFESNGPRDQFRIAASGVTRFGLTASAIGSSVFPIPPLSEQLRIADYLDRETRKLDALIHVMDQAIDRLANYRSTVVSAAVTGRIDVREAGTRHPHRLSNATTWGSTTPFVPTSASAID